jgi:putative tryptophan/tyrosine transport system substrate-binding protein
MKLVLAAWCLLASVAAASNASSANRLVHIGFLRAEAPDVRLQYFKDGMRALGYVEGQTFIVEERWGNGNFDELPHLAQELVSLGVDVIVTSSTPGAAAASAATKTIPIVVAGIADPVASGLVTSLARPGGNLTGLTIMLDDITAKRLEILKGIAPRAKRITVLWPATNPVYGRIVQALGETAAGQGVHVDAVKVLRYGALEAALKETSMHRPDALYIFEDPILISGTNKILAFAAKGRLPAIYGAAEFVRRGGLISYGTSHEHLFRRAAWFVDRILQGTRPADLPIEQPTEFELVVNMKTAKALGLTVPEPILLRASEVIR